MYPTFVHVPREDHLQYARVLFLCPKRPSAISRKNARKYGEKKTEIQKKAADEYEHFYFFFRQ